MDTIIDLSRKNRLSHLLNISVNLCSFPQVLATAKAYPEVWASVGIHPCYDKEPETTVEELMQHAAHPEVVAIGECGLDYYMNQGCCPRDNDFQWQRDRFALHIEAAKAARLPLIVHTRDAISDTIKCMQDNQADHVGGVMHCYVEDWENAKKAMDMNFMISFSGIVTFKNARDLQAVAKQVPDDYLLIETDSPYLAPVPHRGKLNQPAYVSHVAAFLAELRATSVEHIAHITHQNFTRLFLDKQSELC